MGKTISCRNSSKKSGNHVKKSFVGSIALLTLIFLGLLAGSFWLARSTGKTLKTLRSEIAAAGDPIYYTDYATTPIPARDNAYELLSEAEQGVNAYAELVSKLTTKINPGKSNDTVVPQNAPSRTQKQQEAFFSENSALFALLEQASRRPGFRADIDRSRGFDNSLAYLQTIKQAIMMLADKASMLASRGEGDAASTACLTGYRILHLTEQEPSLIGFLSECAGLEKLGNVVHQTLATCDVSDPIREQIDKQLQKFNLNANLTNALKIERATGLLVFQEFHQAKKGSAENQLPLPAFFAETNISKAYLNDDEATYIEYMNQCISEVNQTKTSRDQRLNEMILELSDSGFLKFVSKTITPDVTGTLDAKDDTVARLNALRLLLAVQRQPSVQIESLPPTIKTDPYTTNDMIVRKTASGWLVYSVGRNLKDDAGNLTPTNPSQQPPDIGYKPLPAQPSSTN